jgi:hypothetical protein
LAREPSEKLACAAAASLSIIGAPAVVVCSSCQEGTNAINSDCLVDDRQMSLQLFVLKGRRCYVQHALDHAMIKAPRLRLGRYRSFSTLRLNVRISRRGSEPSIWFISNLYFTESDREIKLITRHRRVVAYPWSSAQEVGMSIFLFTHDEKLNLINRLKLITQSDVVFVKKMHYA